MGEIIKLVIAVVIGNLCTAGLAVLAIDLGLHTRLFDIREVEQESVSSAASIAVEPQTRPRYKARVPVPGHPIEYCLGPERELNNTVQECRAIKVMTVYDDEPIPNPVARLRETLRNVCEGDKGASMSSEQHQEWCEMHTRMQLYGDSIRVQPATPVN